MLAGHHRVIAKLVAGGIGHITCRVHGIIAFHLEIAIDMQAALAVALATDLLGERVGLEAHGPDHRAGVDALAVVQQHAGRVDRGYRGATDPLHAQGLGGLLDGGADAVTQGRANPRPTVDHHHAQRRVLAEDFAQAGRQFGGGLDAGKATAGYHHGIARRCVGQVRQ
ncbi:hypothetical protein D3C79_771990 [compost metagenome]